MSPELLSAYEDRAAALFVPDFLIQPEDVECAASDPGSAHIMDNLSPSHLGSYWNSPQAQRDIALHESAALRLAEQTPHLFNALAAHADIQRFVRQTPLVNVGADIWVKQEYLQAGGSFKDRGGAFAVLQVPPELRKYGVKTTSHGNHGNGMARMARALGMPSVVYSSVELSGVKQRKMEALGARVIKAGNTFEEADARRRDPAGQYAMMTDIEAYDARYTQIGQSTLLIDTLSQAPDVQTLVVPIGGGGMISRLAAAFKEYNPDGKVIGAVFEGNNSSRYSKLAGRLVSITESDPFCDGTALLAPGSTTMPYILDYVDDVVEVDRQTACETMAAHFENFGARVEVAGILAESATRLYPDKLVGKTIAFASGNNIDDSHWDEAMDTAGRLDLTMKQHALAA